MRNGLTRTSGAKFVLEDSKKSPSIVSNGISVRPGTETNIGMLMKTITRLHSPYKSKCEDDYLMGRMNVIGFIRNFEYSARNCKSWCYIFKLFDKCCFAEDLVEGVMPDQFDVWMGKYNVTIEFCKHLPDSDDQRCISKVREELDNADGGDDCQCHAECEETQIMVSWSLNSIYG